MKNSKYKKINILIPNATSPRNIGDLAMLESLISLIKGYYKNVNISIHSADPYLYKSKLKIKNTLYSWAVFSNTNPLFRILRMTQLIIAFVLIKLNLNNNFIPLDSELKIIINDYKNADIIFFVGGGYLRSKNGFSQSLNLIMQLSLFRFTSYFSSKIYIAPISFGPFAYKWQEMFAVNSIKKCQLITVRENYSFKILNKYKLKNLFLQFDHAFLTKIISNKRINNKKTVIGITIRNWLSKEKQNKFENSIVKALYNFSNNKNIVIKPIVQVDAPNYGEDDKQVTKRIIAKLKKLNIETMKIVNYRGLDLMKRVYSNLDLLIGMRMHSNILAAVQGTPFIAISYEHKSEGISEMLNMEKYCIRCSSVTENILFNKLIKAYKNKYTLRKQLSRSIKNIKINEIRRWKWLLSNY